VFYYTYSFHASIIQGVNVKGLYLLLFSIAHRTFSLSSLDLFITHLVTEQITVPFLPTSVSTITHLVTEQITVPFLPTSVSTITHLVTEQITVPFLPTSVSTIILFLDNCS